MKIPFNCGTASLEGLLNKSGKISVIISGGSKHQNILSEVKSLSFSYQTINGIRQYYASEELVLPNLPEKRYLHQSVVVKIGSAPHLLVIGGKVNELRSNAVNTVYKLNLHAYIESKLSREGQPSVTWAKCANMKEARCMFAAITFDSKQVYVYGGTQNSEPGFNVMAKSICERYDAETDTWAEVKIENAISLSAFGWC